MKSGKIILYFYVLEIWVISTWTGSWSHVITDFGINGVELSGSINSGLKQGLTFKFLLGLLAILSDILMVIFRLSSRMLE
jgi:hypothetical protein